MADATENVAENLEKTIEGTMKEAGGENGCCRDNKACLWTSFAVGVCFLIADIVLACVALTIPKVLGISADDALSKEQRILLGVITILIFVEGIVIATVDWCE